MIRSALALATLLLLTACLGTATPPPRTGAPPNSVAAAAGTVVLEGERALVRAGLVYDSAARVAEALVRAGVIRGSGLDKLSALNREATAALDFGFSAASAAEKTIAARNVMSIVTRIRALAKGRL